MRWSANGHQIAVGDDQGKISLIDVNESYVNPRPDDWTRMVKVLADLKRSTAEIEEASTSGVGNAAGNTSNANAGPGTPGSVSSQATTPVLGQSGLTVTPTALPSVKSESAIDFRIGGASSASSYLSSPPHNYAINSLAAKQSPSTPK